MESFICPRTDAPCSSYGLCAARKESIDEEGVTTLSRDPETPDAVKDADNVSHCVGEAMLALSEIVDNAHAPEGDQHAALGRVVTLDQLRHRFAS